MVVAFPQGLSQSANVYVYGSFFYVNVATPDLIQQLRSSIYPFLVSHEKLQQSVFGGAHAERALVGGYPVANGVEGEAVDFWANLMSGGKLQREADARQRRMREEGE